MSEEPNISLEDLVAHQSAILNTTVDAIITINRQGVIQSFNRAAEEMFGYPAAEVVGQSVQRLMPEDEAREHDGYMQAYESTGVAKIIGIGRETHARRKSGEIFPIDLAVSKVESPKGVYYTGVIRDISERRRLERDVIDANDDVRRQIGEQLYHNLGQTLTGIGLLGRSIARQLGDCAPHTRRSMDELVQLVEEADREARAMAESLAPVSIGEEGLNDALPQLIREMARRTNRRHVFAILDDIPPCDPTHGFHVYRLLEDILTETNHLGPSDYISLTHAHQEGSSSFLIEAFGRDCGERDFDDIVRRRLQYRGNLIGASIKPLTAHADRFEVEVRLTCVPVPQTQPESATLWPS